MKSFKNLKKGLSNKKDYLPIVIEETKEEAKEEVKEEIKEETKEDVKEVEQIEEVKYISEPIEIELNFNNIYEVKEVVNPVVNAMNAKAKFSDIVKYIVIQNKFIKKN